MNGIWVQALPGVMLLGNRTGPLCPIPTQLMQTMDNSIKLQVVKDYAQ